MIAMHISLDGDAAWPDLAGKEVIHVQSPIRVVTLKAGLTSGRPSVAIRLELPDGQTVVAETTARLFVSAARAILGRYPDLFEGDA